MKFLLINPFVDYSVIKEIFANEAQVPTLGLLYIASPLEKEGHDVEIIDFYAEKFSEKRLTQVLYGKDAVGITVRSQGKKSVETIIDLIKKTNPNMPIIIGGPHCTLDPIQAILDTKADICVEGDGEKVITKIAEALQGKIKLSEIPGIYYLENNNIMKGPPAEIIEDLDSLPFPARHLVEKYRYGDVQGDLKLGKVTSIIMSRGCPYNCKFCANRAVTKKYRSRSAENIIKEIREIKQKYDFLDIIDDNFFVDIKRADKILDFLIEEKHNLKIGIYGVRVDAPDKNLFKKMKKAGVKVVFFGLESGNQEVLDFYNKGTNLDQIHDAVRLADKAGLITWGSFIFGAPIETEKHLQTTIKFAKELRLDVAAFVPLGYFKGSPLWIEAVAEGKIREDEFYVKSDSARGLGNFSDEELSNWCIKAFKEYYLRPSYILNQILRSIIRRDLLIAKLGLGLLFKENSIIKYKMVHL